MCNERNNICYIITTSEARTFKNENKRKSWSDIFVPLLFLFIHSCKYFIRETHAYVLAYDKDVSDLILSP